MLLIMTALTSTAGVGQRGRQCSTNKESVKLVYFQELRPIIFSLLCLHLEFKWKKCLHTRFMQSRSWISCSKAEFPGLS